MKDQIEIKVLLERFHQGISTPDENLQLLRQLDKNSHELDKLAQKIWDESSEIEDDSEKAEVLKILHQKLGFKEDEQHLRIKPLKVFALVLRYAAILVFGFGLAWLFLSRNRELPGTSKADAFFRVTVAYGSKSTIDLPDGSVVTLNSGSTLKYPGTFAVSDRTVILDGEAFFDVKKNPSRPFLVRTKDITVKVLGTTFNVKSYSDDNHTETTLVTGKVEIIRNNIANNAEIPEKPLVLTPNQKAVFYRESNTLALGEDPQSEVNNAKAEPLDLKVLVQKEIKTESVTSWKNNILVFNSEPFGDIITKLERWYNVEVTLKYPKLAPVVFSGKFDKESVQEVLHALSLIEPFRYEINKNQILIYK